MSVKLGQPQTRPYSYSILTLFFLTRVPEDVGIANYLVKVIESAGVTFAAGQESAAWELACALSGTNPKPAK